MPKLVFPMAALVSNIINLLLSLIPLALLVPVMRHPFYWTWLYLPVPLLALTIFTMGMTFFFAAANVYYRDVAHILQVVLSAWFYVTPIIYSLDFIPAKHQWIFKLNPIIYVINGFRLSVYYGSCRKRRRSLLRSFVHSSACSLASAFFASIRTNLSFTSKLAMSFKCNPQFDWRTSPSASGSFRSVRTRCASCSRSSSGTSPAFTTSRRSRMRRFEVPHGQMLGIIGRNGSGKSTLLKIIAGVYRPTKGKVEVKGTLAPLIELGAGFHHELTGRENILLNGLLMGYSKREMLEREQSIIEFAEIGDFIDAPVKQYSSGMYMRLAFSVATEVDPEILLIDEILAVGDAPFQQKCFERIQNFRQAGKTIMFVTHAMEQVAEHCDRAILIDQGSIMADGRPDEVIPVYLSSVAPEVVVATT